MQLKRRLEALEARQQPPEQRHIVITRWIVSVGDDLTFPAGRTGRLVHERTHTGADGRTVTVRTVDPKQSGGIQIMSD
jgi:hypothetical protein